MKKWMGLLSAVVLCLGSGMSVAASHYTTGLKVGDKDAVSFTYTPLALNEGRNLDRLVKGEVPEDGIARFNEHRLGNLGQIEVNQPITIGETDLEKGTYKFGLHAKPEGKFAFVVWTGEGDDAEAHETALELAKQSGSVDYLILSLQPAWEGTGSWLGVAYGPYHAAVPVGLGGGKKAGSDSDKDSDKEADFRYCTGLKVDDKEVVHISFSPTAYAQGETFEKMRKGEYSAEQMENWFNASPRFGKVGTFMTAKSTRVGTLDTPAGTYPCGLNVDGEGNFTFVGWDGDTRYKTKVELAEHDLKIPHLAMVLTPSGENGSNLVILYGSHHTIVPVGLGGASN